MADPAAGARAARDRVPHGSSRWPLVADLPLVVEGCAFERLHTVQAYDFQRVTTHVRLIGGATDGLGEDVSIHVENGTSLHETRPDLPLRGEWTVAASRRPTRGPSTSSAAATRTGPWAGRSRTSGGIPTWLSAGCG
jgi:hypothetical protein